MSEYPSYSSSGPNRKAGSGNGKWSHCTPILVPCSELEGVRCRVGRYVGEWLEHHGGKAKCGWFGDELAIQTIGNVPLKCGECRVEAAPRKEHERGS